MSLSVLRDALRPQRSLLRNLLLVFAAVAMIVAGLLAMHSLNLESHHDEIALAEHAVVVGHHHADPADATMITAGVSDACPDDCGTEHSVMGACILALATAVMALFSAAIVSRWSAVGPALARLVSNANALAVPFPPSLHILSISRT